MIGNFGELKAAVASRAVRSDLTALIPDFIRSAHDYLVANLELSADLTLDAASVSLPSDFRVDLAVIADAFPKAVLTKADAGQLQNAGSGRPTYYRIDGTTLYLAPAPDRAYAGRVLYKPSRTFFAADADTNTALTRYPFLYVYGAMAELFAHTRNESERDRYLNLFTSGVETAVQAEREDFHGAGVLQPLPSMVV